MAMVTIIVLYAGAVTLCGIMAGLVLANPAGAGAAHRANMNTKREATTDTGNNYAD